MDSGRLNIHSSKGNLSRNSRHVKQRGASIVELLVTMLALAPLVLGAIQAGFFFNAKSIVNNAVFEAGRAGSVENAQRAPMLTALSRNLMPLYGGGQDAASLAAAWTKAELDVRTISLTTLDIISPSQQAFDEYGIEINDQLQIPNEHLAHKSHDRGDGSGVSLQDANVLKIRVTYGYKLIVPVINRLIARSMLIIDPSPQRAAYYAMDPPRIPIVAHATVRMQSNAWPDNNMDVPKEDVSGGSGGDGDAGGGDTGGGDTGGGNTGGGDTGGGDTGGGDTGGGPGGQPDVGQGPAPGDPPVCEVASCSNGEPAGCTTAVSSTSSPVTAQAVGNPINVITGNKYQQEIDISALKGNLALVFDRHYNSLSKHDKNIGYGWTHTYDVRLHRYGSNTIYVDQSDGRRVIFNKSTSDNFYSAQMASDGWVKRDGENYHWYWRSGQELTFGSEGRLNQIITPSNDSVDLIYSRNGQLLQVSDPQDRTIAFEYYSNSRIKSVTGPRGKRISYSYDNSGNLSRVNYPDKSHRTYHYESSKYPNALTGITDTRGLRFSTYAYDGLGRAVLSTHAENDGKVVLQFKKDKTLVTKNKNKQSIYHTKMKNGVGLVTKIEGINCSACGRQGDVKYKYNNNYQLTQVVYRDSSRVNYSYDSKNRIKRIMRTGSTGKTSLVREYQYAKNGLQPVLITLPSVAPGKPHEFLMQYTTGGKLAVITELGYRPDGKDKYVPIQRTKKYQYDRNANLIAVDGPLPGEEDKTLYSYNVSDQLEKITYPENISISFSSYDENNRPSIMVDPNGVVHRYRYNFQGQVTQFDKGSYRYKIKYDSEGRPSHITKPDGSYLETKYNAGGQITSLSDSEGNKINWGRDSESNLSQISIIDSLNQLSMQSDYSYSQIDNTINISSPDGALDSFNYDPNGKLLSKTNGASEKQTFHYDHLGRLSAIVKAAESNKSSKTKFEYNVNNLQTKLINTKGNTATKLYDDFGLLIVEKDLNDKVTLYRYDTAGRKLAQASSANNITVYGYDNFGRIISVGNQKNKKSTQYLYKGTRLSAVKGPLQSVRYEYDIDGNLVKQVKSVLKQKFVTEYRYDKKTGKLLEKDLPDGQTLVYAYHSVSGKLLSVSRKKIFGETRLLDKLSYQPFGGINGFTQGNGFETKLEFTSSGKLNTLKTAGVLDLSYQYNQAGRLTSLKRNGVSEQFEYNQLGNLRHAKTANYTYSWNYDNGGNRLGQKSGNENTKYTYGKKSNRLLAIQKTKLIPYLYNSLGDPVIVGNKRYTYTASGKPSALYIDGKLKATYLYNYLGQRIFKTLESNGKLSSTIYLYEGSQLVAEANVNGKVTSQYMYLGDRPVAKLEGKALYYIHSDHIGTPQLVTDESKKVVWKASYTPFGEARIEKAAITLNIRLPGHYYDSETNSHYNYHRYYDPQTGRYLTSDPIGTAGDINNFTYANANPLQNTDVLGLYGTEVHYYLTYFLARMAGLEAKEASTIALAAQYIDDNHETQPLTLSTNVLSSYHFTFNYDNVEFGGRDGDASEDPATRFWHNGILSDQQQRLRNAAVGANNTYDDGSALRPCTRAQFYGEFVHAFQDSYAHREKDNRPFQISGEGLLPGHGSAGHEPDYTYNGIDDLIESWEGTPDDPDYGGAIESVTFDTWGYREARTLAMEQELWNMFQQDFEPVIAGPNPACPPGQTCPQVPVSGGAIDGGGSVTAPVTWQQLAGDNTPWILTGGRDANGFPLDSLGQPINTFGKIVDADGQELPNTPINSNPPTSTNPPRELNDVQWQRTCDTSANGSGCAANDSVLFQFNREQDPDEKIAILQFWMADNGFESIPDYSAVDGQINREQYLSGITNETMYQGVILPFTNFP